MSAEVRAETWLAPKGSLRRAQISRLMASGQLVLRRLAPIGSLQSNVNNTGANICCGEQLNAGAARAPNILTDASAVIKNAGAEMLATKGMH